MDSAQFFSGQAVYFYHLEGKNKAGLKWHGQGIIIGRFGREGDLIYLRGNPIDVDINGFRPSSKIFDVLGCDCTLHLAQPISPIRYSLGSQTLLFLAKIRNVILLNKQTTWANTDTRLGPNVF